MADLQGEVQAAADEMVAAGTETGLPTSRRSARRIDRLIAGTEEHQ